MVQNPKSQVDQVVGQNFVSFPKNENIQIVIALFYFLFVVDPGIIVFTLRKSLENLMKMITLT